MIDVLVTQRPVAELVAQTASEPIVLAVTAPVAELVATVDQGVAGPPGGASFTRTASTTLQGGYLVTADGDQGARPPNLVLADAFMLLGFTSGSAAEGAEVEIVGQGDLVDPGWAWTPGLPVFCGPGGLPTQTPPTSGVMVQVGVAISVDSILVNIRQPIQLLGD